MTDLGCWGLIQSHFVYSGMIQGRFHPASAISIRFGHFSCRPIRPNSANTAWFWQNLPSSAQIKAESARIEPSQRKSMKKKKKKAQTRHRRVDSHVGRCTPRRATSDSGAAFSQLRPCFIGFQMVERNLIKINKPFRYGF